VRFHAVISGADVAAGERPGLVHEAVLADHPDLSGHDLYMSGPPPMIDAGHQRFLEAGLPEDRLYYDSFDYAPEVLARIITGRAGFTGF
jgi:CDP-4-dehydro-6-deoxyglucose reductase